MEPSVRVGVLGACGTGKTPLIIKFVQNRFVEEYDPTFETIEDSYRKLGNLDDTDIVYDILDTSGNEEYCTLRDQFIRTCDGFLLVYSITSRASYNDLDAFHDNMLRVKNKPSVPMVVVGNKCDLEEARQVAKSEGEITANSWNCPFFETSAKTGVNVKEAFYQVVREIWGYNDINPNENEKESSGKQKCFIM